MAREMHRTTIDGHLYEMTMLGASQGYRLFHRLFAMLGPSLGAIMDSAGNTRSLLDMDLSSKVVVQAIEGLTRNVKEGDLEHVIDTLRKQCHVGVDGNEKTVPLGNVFEAHFSGEIGGLFKWLAWGLKVQFGSFLTAFESLTPPVLEGASPAGSSPSQ